MQLAAEVSERPPPPPEPELGPYDNPQGSSPQREGGPEAAENGGGDDDEARVKASVTEALDAVRGAQPDLLRSSCVGTVVAVLEAMHAHPAENKYVTLRVRLLLLLLRRTRPLHLPRATTTMLSPAAHYGYYSYRSYCYYYYYY